MNKMEKTHIEEMIKTSKKLHKQTDDYMDSTNMKYDDSTTYTSLKRHLEMIIGALTIKLEENKEEE